MRTLTHTHFPPKGFAYIRRIAKRSRFLAAERVFWRKVGVGQMRTTWQTLREWLNAHRSFAYMAVYALVALAILLPLLGPGHIMTLDMALTPRLPLPESVTSAYFLHLVLYSLNALIPTPIIEKALLFLILFLSGVGMHRLVQYLRIRKPQTDAETWGRYVAGLLYMVNPYTYSRFMTGQYLVLLGYALLPFFARALLAFLTRPAWRTVLPLTTWGVAISIVSIHSIGLMALLSLLAVILFVWRYRHQRKHIAAIIKYAVTGLVIAALASSHWLLPLLFGRSNTAQIVNTFGAGDQQTFATIGENVAGQLSYIVQLQGFWAEATDTYLLPQDVLLAWVLVAILVLTLVIIGGVTLWRHGRRLETVLFGLSAGTAALLATNLASQIGNWAPILGGYREPHKFVGLVALCYALFAGTGATAIIQRYQTRSRPRLAHAATSLFLILPVLFTPVMFWGFSGQLQPRQYPSEWFAMNDRLKSDKTSFQVLFLPWHRYMPFRFSERSIVNPADRFFDKPVIASTDPEYGKASPDRVDPDADHIDKQVLPNAASRDDFGTQIASLNVKFILLAKESDFVDYTYLDRQTDLQLTHEDAAFKLYHNRAWEN